MNPEYRKYIATALLAVLGAVLLYLLRIFFLALFGAYVFAFLFAPVYVWIKNKIGRDQLAALLTVILIMIVALGPMLLVCYVAFAQAVELKDNLDPSEVAKVFERFGPRVKERVDRMITRLTSDLSTTLAEAIPSIVETMSRLVVSLFLMFFVMYYMFLDIHYILIRSTEYLPFKQSNAIWLIRQFEHISRALLFGQLLLSALQGIMGGIGFFLFGVRDSVLWGLVMAVFSLVPIVGTSIIWLPAVLYKFIQQDYFAGIGLLLWGTIIISNIDNAVRPLLGKKLGNINPIVTMLGAFAGIEFFGIAGVVVGPFLLASFFLLLQVYRQEYLGHPVPLTRAQILRGDADG